MLNDEQILLKTVQLLENFDISDKKPEKLLREIDEDEWEVAIQRGLKKRVEQLQEARARREQAAAAEDAAFSEAFLNLARQIFRIFRFLIKCTRFINFL